MRENNNKDFFFKKKQFLKTIYGIIMNIFLKNNAYSVSESLEITNHL